MKQNRKSTIACQQCGKEFSYYLKRPRKFCSRHCATVHRNLSGQNPAHKRDMSGENNPMFGRGFCGESNPMYGKRLHLSPRWRGGRKTRKDGYSFVVAPPDHPYPSYVKPNGLKYVLEHRYVMEQHLGRYLLPEEVVHHIDRNPANNAIENLQLFRNQSEHISIGHRQDQEHA